MSMGGGGGTTTVQKADPWSGVQPYLTGAGGTTRQLKPGVQPIYASQAPGPQGSSSIGLPNMTPDQAAYAYAQNQGLPLPPMPSGGGGLLNPESDYETTGGTPGIYPEASRLYQQGGWTQQMQQLMDQQMQALSGRSGQVQQAQGIANDVLSGAFDPNLQQAKSVAAQMVDPTQAFGSLGAADPTSSISQMLTGQANTSTLDPVVNNAIQRATQGFNQQVLPQLRGQAVASGQYGGSRQGIAEGLASQGLQQEIGDMSANMYNNAYNTAQQNMYGTANNMAGLGLSNSQANANRDLSAQQFNSNLTLQNNQQAMQEAQQKLASLGQGLNLLGTGNALQDQTYAQQQGLLGAPNATNWQNLGNYAGIIQPGAGIGGTSSTTTPLSSNPLAGALGGGVAMAGIQSAMPSLFQGAVGAAGPQIPGALSSLGGFPGLALGAGLGLLGGLIH